MTKNYESKEYEIADRIGKAFFHRKEDYAGFAFEVAQALDLPEVGKSCFMQRLVNTYEKECIKAEKKAR